MSASKTWRDLIKVHPAAELFPMMSDTELAELAADIGENGIRQAIVLWTPEKREEVRPRKGPQEVYLLDGRNRLEALQRSLAVDPCCENDEEREDEIRNALYFDPAHPTRGTDITFLYGDDDPYEHVISLNLRRRHLDTSQRAMVAAKIANLKEGRPSKTPSNEGVSQAEAAKLLNVSPASVERASTVLRAGAPNVIEAVERGTASVNAAAAAVKTAPPKAQTTWTPGDIKRVAKENGHGGAELLKHLGGAPTKAAPRAEPAAHSPLAVLAEVNPFQHRLYDEALGRFSVALHDERPRVSALPLAKRVAYARGWIADLGLTLDDFRPIA